MFGCDLLAAGAGVMDARRRDLAKIHMGAQALGLITRGDDSNYRVMLTAVAGVESAAALDVLGRAKVLAHLRKLGWKPTKPRAARPPVADQVAMIRALWAHLAAAGVVQNHTEAGLRAWLKSQTRKYHPQRAGYGAPEFLPGPVAQRVIEQLKGWCQRCEVDI